MDKSELPEDITALTKLAEDGNADAQVELGTKYYKGLGVEKNYNLAFDWCRRAAEQEHLRALNALGVMYKNGFGVDKNEKEAIDWFRKAAEQNYAAAQNNLGIMYEHGFGIKQNHYDAFGWYHKAAEQDHAAAQFKLGWMYDFGIGVEQDDTEAIFWYEKSAKHESDSSSVYAKFNLGLMYLDGQGVDKNYTKAQELFSQAAKSTNPDIRFDAIEYQDKAERYQLSENITEIREKILYKLKADIKKTPTMTHYTSLVAGHALLFEPSPLRLGHINALNDPNEGKLLWRYLGHTPVEGKPVFVGCFLPDDDSLNMWRFYSKNLNNEDACGCAITYNSKKFLDYNLLEEPLIDTQQNETKIVFSNTGKSPKESAAFYRVIYISDEMHIHGDDKKQTIKNLFIELKNETQVFLGDTPGDEEIKKLSKLLGPLPFLLKDADYEAEKEHRIIVTHLEYGAKEIKVLEPVLENGIPKTAPKLYLELHRTNHLEPVKHVTLGPKSPHQEMMAPYWHHMLASDFPDQLKAKPDFYVRTSRCAYK